ncbi:hypothetical protein AADY36_06615 [Pseudoalteromonas sp. D15MCD-2]|uniref:hypothetical protein n=1 Tax=Pseudoalteromonas sp. D15MCD-2 TaxID=3138933 RepID=UPI003158B9FB
MNNLLKSSVQITGKMTAKGADRAALVKAISILIISLTFGISTILTALGSF